MKNALFGLMMLVGFGAISLPYIFPDSVGGFASVMLTGFGILIAVLAMAGLVAVNMYITTSANEAIVRTGAFGGKVILNGGTILIPSFQQAMYVSLETMKLVVQRVNEDALISSDNLRIDVVAELFVKVSPNAEGVQKAAQSLGEKMGDMDAVRKLVDAKAEGALRGVAATKSLSELHTMREDFVAKIKQDIEADLRENGLMLEAVTISKLDQTSIQYMRDDNLFDAQGRETIAGITEAARTRRNKIEQQGKQDREAQDVEAAKRILSLKQEEAEATALQEAAIVTAQADSKREGEERTIAAQRKVELAAIGKAKDIEVASAEKAQATQVATVAQEKAVQLATEQQQQEVSLAAETKKKTVALAVETRETDVAKAQKLKAEEEARLAEAQAAKQEEVEKTATVQIVAAADRQKRKAVLEAEAAAESEYVTKKRDADAKAYGVETDATARKTAADADAEATVKKANADKTAELAKVDAERAKQLVPVDVDKGKVAVAAAQVAVDKDRLEQVTVPELRAREEHGKVAQDFELAQLRITQEATVKIETARATASIVGKIEATVFGTPEDVSRMTSAYMLGQNINAGLQGLGVEQDAGSLVESVVSKATEAIQKKLAAPNNGTPPQQDSPAE